MMINQAAVDAFAVLFVAQAVWCISMLFRLDRAYAAVVRAVRHAKALEEDRDLQERMLKDVLALATFEDEEVADALFDVYLAGRQSLVRRYPDLVE
jgi:hypothetical protein